MIKTIPDAVRAAAERWPDTEAIVDGPTRLTFAELAEQMDRSMRGALEAGLLPGDRAAIWAPNCAEWIIAALGVHGAGGAVVPLNTRYKGEEAAYILNRSGARLLFTVTGFLGTDYPSLLDGHDTPVERTVVFHTPGWDEYLSAAGAAVPPGVTGDFLSDIIFTSGTTGRPKGVMTRHEQSVRVAAAWADVVGLQAGDRYLLVSPFFHTAGYKAGFVAAILHGATVLPMAVADIPAIFDVIEKERVTVFPGTPTIFQSMLDDPSRAGRDISSLRLSAVGAASVPVELVERMRDELFEVVVTGYGLTETVGVSTMSRPDDPPEIVSRTVGRALPEVEVRVDDKGEVLIRGYNVMSGYFGDDAALTGEVIDEEGWLHTGDIGSMDENGYLSIVGRLKDMFIVGGFNAYPAEIEAALLRHPDLAMAAVVGMPDRRLGEVGAAFVVPKPGRTVDPDEVIAFARQEMANYKVPRRVEVVDELPLNAVGKVQKDVLRSRLA